jgi:hypothetical protein
MKHHLTERELIECQFKLASERRVQKISGHLKDCAQCRQHLEELKAKFAALELVREELEPSEELISRVLAEVSQPIPARVVSFGRPAWIGAAAAVLLMGALLFVSRLDWKRGKLAAPPRKPDMRITNGTDVRGPLGEPVTPVTPEAISDEPPFAPASAIELVVLPRRESIQLTIYNSTFQTWAAERGFGSGYGGYGGYGTSGYGTYGQRGDLQRYGERRETTSAESAAPAEREADKRARRQLEKQHKRIEQLKRVLEESSASGGLDERARSRLEKRLKKLMAESRSTAAGILERARRGIERSSGYGREASGAVAGGDLTLVRERRNLTLKKGWNWLQFMWANTLIDPTSLNLEPLGRKDKIDVQQLVFPPRLRELGRWLIRSQVSGQVPFEITYFTSGLTWRAFYMGTLSQDEKTMRLQGYVRVTNNSGDDYENAETRLVVGKVHILDKIIELAQRQYPYGSPLPEVRQGGPYGGGYSGYGRYGMGMYGGGYGGAMPTDEWKLGALFRRKEIIKEGLSEYFLYSIEGKESIPNQWGKRLQSFDVKNIDVNSLYKYDEERWGEQTIRFVSFVNDEDHNLGQTPIPDGGVKIYGQADEQGYLSYVGGTNIKYIPVDEEIELDLGAARLVKVEPVLMDFKTENYLFDADDNIAGWDEIRTWKMEMTNARQLQVEIEIKRGFGTPYWKLQYDADGVSYDKYDVDHARFKAEVVPRTKRKFNYTVRTYHGTRQEHFDR